MNCLYYVQHKMMLPLSRLQLGLNSVGPTKKERSNFTGIRFSRPKSCNMKVIFFLYHY